MTPSRNETERIDIRGHHLLILDFFHHRPEERETLKAITQRLGYGDTQYEEVIRPILEKISSNPNARVRLSDEPGSICFNCKARRPDCTQSVGHFDRRTLESLGLKVGQEITAGELIQKIKGCGNEELERIKKLLQDKKAGSN